MVENEFSRNQNETIGGCEMAKYKKPKHQEILTKFIETFENGKPFTSSEIRMNGIKLSQLKKTVKEYILKAGIETDKPVEVIIWQEIDYCSMMGFKFRSIASLGYQVLGESIRYWEKREKTLQQLEEEKEKEKMLAEQNNSYEDVGSRNNERLANTRKKIAWADDE